MTVVVECALDWGRSIYAVQVVRRENTVYTSTELQRIQLSRSFLNAWTIGSLGKHFYFESSKHSSSTSQLTAGA